MQKSASSSLAFPPPPLILRAPPSVHSLEGRRAPRNPDEIPLGNTNRAAGPADIHGWVLRTGYRVTAGWDICADGYRQGAGSSR